ncbi:unnamed protein product, partial [Nesidiocoris tenuis]
MRNPLRFLADLDHAFGVFLRGEAKDWWAGPEQCDPDGSIVPLRHCLPLFTVNTLSRYLPSSWLSLPIR